MSVFTPFRNKTALTTALVVGSALKLTPTWVTGHQVLYAQNQQVNIAQINGAAPIPAVCDNSTGVQSTNFQIITSTQVQIVPASTKSVYVCGWSFTTPDSSQVVKFVEGSTGDHCVTSEAIKAGPWNFSSKSGMVVPNAGHVQFKTSSGMGVCLDITSTGGLGVGGIITFIPST